MKNNFIGFIASLDAIFWYIFSFIILCISVYMFFYLDIKFIKKLRFFFKLVFEKIQHKELLESERRLNLKLNLKKVKKEKEEKKISKLNEFKLLGFNISYIGIFSMILHTILTIRMVGLGSIFWLWVLSPFFATLGYAESILVQSFKIKRGNTFLSGPYVYSEKLNKTIIHFGIFKKISLFISLLVLIISIAPRKIFFLESYFRDFLEVNPFFISIALISFLILSLIIYKKKLMFSVISYSSILALIMFLIPSIIVLLVNFNAIPEFIFAVFSEGLMFFEKGKTAFWIVILMVISNIVYSSRTYAGFVSASEYQADFEHPVQVAIIKVFSFYINIIVATLVSVLYYLMDINFSTLSLEVKNSILIIISILKRYFGAPIVPIFSVLFFAFFISSFLAITYNILYQINLFNLMKRKKLLKRFLVFFIAIFFFIITYMSTFRDILYYFGNIIVGIIICINIILIFLYKKVIKNVSNNYENFNIDKRIGKDCILTQNEDFSYWLQKEEEKKDNID